LALVGILWTDIPSLQSNSGLLGRIKENARLDIYVPYSEEFELSILAKLLPSRRVFPFKRPIIFHELVELVERQGAGNELSLRSTKAVRFATSLVSNVSGQSPAVPDGDRQATIILAEDNVVNSKLGERLLKKLGYTVITSFHGLECLGEVEKAAEGEIAAILMDCQMPVMGGTEATRRIRKLEEERHRQTRIPILAMSANVTVKTEEDCRASGMDGFLPKPITLDQLDRALQNHITPLRGKE